MENFIDKIQQTNNVSVFITKNDREILACNGCINEVIVDSEIISLDLEYCELTIDKSWKIQSEDEGMYVFDCGDNLRLYIDGLD